MKMNSASKLTTFTNELQNKMKKFQTWRFWVLMYSQTFLTASAREDSLVPKKLPSAVETGWGFSIPVGRPLALVTVAVAAAVVSVAAEVLAAAIKARQQLPKIRVDDAIDYFEVFVKPYGWSKRKIGFWKEGQSRNSFGRVEWYFESYLFFLILSPSCFLFWSQTIKILTNILRSNFLLYWYIRKLYFTIFF